MIDGVTVTSDNLLVNTGGGSVPPPPLSPTETKSGVDIVTATSLAVEVELSSRGKQVGDSAKNSSDRVGSESQGKSEQSMEDRLQEMVETLNQKMARLDRQVEFKLDKRINKNYISVIDSESKEVIREFPPKEIRTFIARFDEFVDKLNDSSDVKSMIVNLEV